MLIKNKTEMKRMCLHAESVDPAQCGQQAINGLVIWHPDQNLKCLYVEALILNMDAKL